MQIGEREKGIMNKLIKVLGLLMVLVISTGILAMPMPAKAEQEPVIAIVPTMNEFGPEPCVGTLFKVECWIYNITDLYGVDIQITWDTDWIRYVNHTKKIPVETYPDGILHSPTIPVHDDVNETGALVEEGAAPGTLYWLAEASMSPAEPFDGSGIAFEMWFNVTNQPGVGEPDVMFEIGFTSVTLGDVNGEPIPHEKWNATVVIHALPVVYPPKPLLKVMPEEVEGTYCELFTIDIWLMGEDYGDLDPFWDVAGFDMYLNFNATLLQAVDVTVDPDGWFAGFWPNGIFIVKQEINNDEGWVWIAFLGIPGDYGEHTEPYGQGRLATITFNATYIQKPPPFEAPCCLLSLNPTTIAGFPHPERPYAPWYGSETAVPIPHVTEDGLYCAPLKLLGPVIDIYTDYPEGYNGEGIGEPNDLVWPQKGFTLYAKVTYNEWPEQNKDVAFQIIDNHGEVWAILVNRTNADGIAQVFIRMPWVCDNPEYYLGEWTIIATVDVACTVVNDTMTFKYDYFVNIWSATADKDEYKHCEDIIITIEYGTYWMQNKEVLFVITGVDDTGVPFDWAKEWVTIGGAEYCSYANGTITLTIHVPKFARAGIATIYVTVFNQWPDAGGSALFPVVPVEISILAE